MLKWTCVRKRVPQMPPVRKPAERAKMHIWDMIMMMLFRIMMAMLVTTCLMMVVISMIYIGMRVLIILIIMVMMMQTKNDGICWWWELQWWKFFNLEPTFYNLFSNKPENAVQHRLLAELKRLKIKFCSRQTFKFPKKEAKYKRKIFADIDRKAKYKVNNHIKFFMIHLKYIHLQIH